MTTTKKKKVQATKAREGWPLVSVSSRWPVGLINEIKDLAHKTDKTFQEITIEAMEQWIAKQSKRR